MPARSTSYLALTESEITEIYNYLPKILQPHVLEVVLTANSLSYETLVTFISQKDGNYWVIKTENSRGWLFPKAGRIFNNHEYPILEYIFDCKQFELGRHKNFWVSQAAKVAANSTETEWTLEEKGLLEFGKVSKASLEVQLERVKQEREELLMQVETSEGTIEQLKIKLQELENKYFQLQHDLATTQQNHQQLLLEEKQKSLDERQKYLPLLEIEPRNDKKVQQSDSGWQFENTLYADYVFLETEEDKKSFPIKSLLDDEEQQLVEDYNRNNLSNWRQILVILTPESEEQLRDGTSKLITLKQAKHDSPKVAYLVIKGEREDYLIPKPDYSFHNLRMQSMKYLFDYRNYTTREKADKFKLIKPSKLSIISKEEWKFEEDGILDFSE